MSDAHRTDSGTGREAPRQTEREVADPTAQRPPPGPIDDHRDDEHPIGDPPDLDPTDDPDDEDEGEEGDDPLHAKRRRPAQRSPSDREAAAGQLQPRRK